jgi:uncharacterized protein YceK
MKMRFGACAATLALSVTSGCGTVNSLTERQSPTYPMSTHSEPRTPYGGVAYDFDVAPWLCVAGPVGVLACAGYLALDLPLSATADTVTLPYVLYIRANEKRTGKPERQDRVQPSADAVTPTAASQPTSP